MPKKKAAPKAAPAAPKKTKKMPGKSVANTPSMVEYKPSIYLENGQIPKGMEKAKVGSKVKLTVEATVISHTERESRHGGKTNEVSLEIQKVTK